MAPVSIPEGYAETARKGLRGEDPKWLSVLGCCDMLDLEKPRPDRPVCISPTSGLQWKDLAEKTKWLRPYASDLFIESIVKQLDQALLVFRHRPAIHNPISEANPPHNIWCPSIGGWYEIT